MDAVQYICQMPEPTFTDEVIDGTIIELRKLASPTWLFFVTAH
jgi:hypothetical protein